MNRIRGVLFHKLKGSPGWSWCDISELDVARVVKVEYRKRYFRLLDWNKPYTLETRYYLPETTTDIAYTLSPKGGIGYTFYKKTSLVQTITKRYELEEQVRNEIALIQKKMDRLDHFSSMIARKLSENMNGQIGDDVEDLFSAPTSNEDDGRKTPR